MSNARQISRSRPTRRRPPRGAALIFPCLVLALLTPTGLFGAPVVEVEYSHRQVGHGWDPPDFEEGHILITFTSDRPFRLLEPDSTFIQVEPNVIERQFQWWETDTLTVVFFDGAHETTEVRAFPEPVFPFEPENHAVPLVNITTDPANLWSPETGIYVWGNHHNWSHSGIDWERDAIFDYWDTSGQHVVSRQVGIRIHGNYSRSYPQKSFRLYFDHHGDPESITHPFFDNTPGDYARLLLRCNYHPGRWTDDSWACTLFADMGHLISNLDFLLVYLNNEYWGTYHLRERFDDKWAEVTLGLDGDEYILIRDGEAENGDPADWWDFLAWVNAPHQYDSHDFFVEASRRLDLAIYIDWLLINIFAAPSDNGYVHNLALLKVGQQPWRYLMWDEDSLFEAANLQTDFFRFFSVADEEEFATYLPATYANVTFAEVALWFGLFDRLLRNAEFRTRFFNRLAELRENLMSLDSMLQRLDNLFAEQDPESDWHGNKYWFGTGYPYSYYVNGLRQWIQNRYPIVMDQAAAFRTDRIAPVELSSFSATEDTAGHRLAWRTESETDCEGFMVFRAQEASGPFELVAHYATESELAARGGPDLPADYEFVVSEVPPAGPSYYRLSHQSGSGEVVHNWVEVLNLPLPDLPELCLNEFMALNSSTIQDETGAYEDWAEIHNHGAVDVDLNGMFLTDDLAQTMRWAFPPGTILPAGGFLLVWCDDDPEDGPLHASFKLAGDGEEVGLFTSLADGNQLIDAYGFGPQLVDISEGRECDCCAGWQFFAAPTPGASNNGVSAAPGPPTVGAGIESIVPNPFNPTTRIGFTVAGSGPVRLTVFDAAGRKVRALHAGVARPGHHTVTWDGQDDAGRAVASGVYQLRLQGQGLAQSRKLTLLR